MSQKVIRISGKPNDDGTVDLNYEDSVVHVHVGDTVGWASEDGPFTINFRNGSPGNSTGMRGAIKGLDHWESAYMSITGPKGHYPYAVALFLQSKAHEAWGGLVAIDSGCPVIIVD